jgi:hypothetical protein
MVMEFGSIQKVVVCIQATDATAAQQTICPAVAGQFYQPVTMQAYLVDPSQQGIIEASMGPFDYAQGGVVWASAFSMVVGMYFVSTAIGSVLGMIRRD